MDQISAFFQQVVEIFSYLFRSREMIEFLSARPEYMIAALVVLNLVIFTETGLLFGFFLPGDSLLVTAGIIWHQCDWNLALILITLSLAAIIGDSVGYAIGYRTGPRIFSRQKSWFFAKGHLLKAQAFYERHGGKTIILARFMPLIRTFAPVVAGAAQMNYRRFVYFNVFGGIGWVFSMVLLGYFLPPLLQSLFGKSIDIQDHIDKVIVVVVLISISPALFAWVRSRFRKKKIEATPVAVAGQELPS